MTAEILVVDRLMPALMDALSAQYTMHLLTDYAGPAGLPGELAGRIPAVVTAGNIGADAALMAALPKLEVITVFGVGVDAVDLTAARSRGIRVTNTPDVLTEDVADMALGLTLAVLRKLCVGDRFVRDGRWRDGPMPLTRSLTGKRIGIVGLGRIGKAAARRFEACGSAIAYCGRTRQAGVAYAHFQTPTSLAAASDVLVICAPGGPDTRHLIDASVLEALGADGVLVNVARGSLVDEPALVVALLNGRIAGAGLDVFAEEPLGASALLTMDTVVLQPHHASGTHETRWAMADLVLRNLAAHFAGQPLPTAVA